MVFGWHPPPHPQLKASFGAKPYWPSVWLQAGYVCFILFLSHSAGCILLIKGIARKIEEIVNRGKFKPTIKISSAMAIITGYIYIYYYYKLLCYKYMICYYDILVTIGLYWFVVYCPMDYTRHTIWGRPQEAWMAWHGLLPAVVKRKTIWGWLVMEQIRISTRWVFFSDVFQMTFDLEIFRSGNAWRAHRFEQPTAWTFLM